MKIDFSKYDTIQLGMSMADKIKDWYLKVDPKVGSGKELPFTEGVVNFGEYGGMKDNKIYFDLVHPKGMFFSVFAGSVDILDFHYSDDGELKIDEGFYKSKAILDLVNSGKYTNPNEIMKHSLLIVMSTLAYISLYANEPIYVTPTRSRSAVTKKPRKGEKKARKVYINKKTYVVNEVSGSLSGRDYEHRMEAWKVRRHPRTYKSGKTIWIEPYIKGDKNKLTQEPTTYVVGDKQINNKGGAENE